MKYINRLLSVSPVFRLLAVIYKYSNKTVVETNKAKNTASVDRKADASTVTITPTRTSFCVTSPWLFPHLQFNFLEPTGSAHV